MSGNPVRIGDGCATVTGYKLPWPLTQCVGKAGARSGPKSGYGFGCTRRVPLMRDGFSVKEKDETSHLTISGGRVKRLNLHSPLCRSLKVFSFRAPALVSDRKHRA